MFDNWGLVFDKQKLINFAVLVAVFIVSSVVIYFLAVNPLLGDNADGLTYTVTLDIKTSVSDTFTLYYDNLDYSRFDEEHKYTVNVKGMSSYQSITFEVPTKNISYLRFSLGAQSNVNLSIRSIKIQSFSHEKTINYDKLSSVFDIVYKMSAFSGRDGYVYTRTTKAGSYFSNSNPIEVTNGRPTLLIISMSISFMLISFVLFVLKMIRGNVDKWYLSSDFLLFVFLFVSLLGIIILGTGISPSGKSDYLIKTLLVLIVFAVCLIISVVRFVKTGEKAKVSDIITVVCLGCVICIPILVSVFFIPKLPSDYQAPDFTLGRFIQYSDEAVEHYNNTYPINTMLSSSYSNMKTFLFNDSQYENVVIGKNNWLFSTDELTSYKRMNSYSKENLISIKNTLSNYEKIFNAHGISFYVLIVPYKTSVYENMMPSSIRRMSREERLKQVYDYLWKYSDMNIVEIRDALVSASYDRDVYYKTDNYLNKYGAYTATNLLLMKISSNDESVDTLDLENYEIEIVESKMKALAMQMGYGDSYTEYDYEFKKNKKQNIIVSSSAVNPYSPYAESSDPVIIDSESLFGVGALAQLEDDNSMYYTDYYVNATNKAALNDKHVVMIHDESALTIMPFITESFGNVSFIFRTGDVLTRDILNEAPDIVVFEISEKYLSELIG